MVKYQDQRESRITTSFNTATLVVTPGLKLNLIDNNLVKVI